MKDPRPSSGVSEKRSRDDSPTSNRKHRLIVDFRDQGPRIEYEGVLEEPRSSRATMETRFVDDCSIPANNQVSLPVHHPWSSFGGSSGSRDALNADADAAWAAMQPEAYHPPPGPSRPNKRKRDGEGEGDYGPPPKSGNDWNWRWGRPGTADPGPDWLKRWIYRNPKAYGGDSSSRGNGRDGW